MMAGPRLLWTAFGWVALALGAIGVLLPVMPTTPFILLAAFAFGKGSPAMRRRLERSRHFGPAIRDWEERGAIQPRHKALACALMGCSLVGAVVLALPTGVVAVQALTMGGAALYILTRPSG
ncbi:hypothetical protein Rumeso_03006 [Rubellimicrobium mesophilum DSM 19309]|uniref:Inner membrane protein YbaN n=1 Tax=Rubellimicrobium mesophilum DSM 19309 TaxID=442562 RepID=A0A017HM51_9RHOB|nr:YbaN family protein [Rubellimicrobium mesophilum]EYD75436.1 hypothetical protein Rumeso_03006 [Rubellimicrobium mesophilum DSM 19309]